MEDLNRYQKFLIHIANNFGKVMIGLIVISLPWIIWNATTFNLKTIEILIAVFIISSIFSIKWMRSTRKSLPNPKSKESDLLLKFSIMTAISACVVIVIAVSLFRLTDAQFGTETARLATVFFAVLACAHLFEAAKTIEILSKTYNHT